MRLSLIVAMTRSGVIGRAGGLPWRLSSDLKRFKSLTMGHHLIMGRKTFLTLGKLLPGRVSLVLKRQASAYDYAYSDQEGNPIPLYDDLVAARKEGRPPPDHAMPLAFVRTLDEAVRLAGNDEEVFVIGGGEIFAMTLPQADRLYVTWVESDVTGDTFFPPVQWTNWRMISSE